MILIYVSFKQFTSNFVNRKSDIQFYVEIRLWPISKQAITFLLKTSSDVVTSELLRVNSVITGKIYCELLVASNFTSDRLI